MMLMVGVDLVSISRIEKIMKKYPARFTERIFSPAEQELFLKKGAHIETLAAAFAAKEAVLKAIGCGIGPAALNEVAVISEPGEQPQVKLSGKAASIAKAKGIRGITVSMTHEPPFACAVAAAY